MTGWLQLLGNLTLASSAAVLLILVLRCLCGRLPKRYLCWLWLPVFLRAVCPVSFSSPFSLYRLFSGFPGFVTSGGRMTLELAGYQNARLRAILEGVGTGAGMGEHPAAEAFIESGNETALVTLLFVIWGAGVAVLLLYGLISWLRLRKRTALAVQTEPGVRESDRIGSAFLLGFFKPVIYLPTDLTKEERSLILEHEKTHRKRQDSRVKMLAWLVVVLHWFNPLLWLAFVLLTRDMEMACDEQVLEKLGTKEKKNYSTLLLKLSAPGSFLSGSPVTFGENAVKSRIKNILRYRKTKTGIAILAVILMALAGWFCLSNPENKEEKVYEVIQTFAEAAENRDAETAWELLSPALQNSDGIGIETFEDGTKTMGFSSPFPADNPIVSVEFGNGTAEAEITYPSMTSDPLWWSVKDYLTLEKNGDTWWITKWETKLFDEITSYDAFEEAYRMWTPNYLNAVDTGDEELSDFASFLVQHDIAGNLDRAAFATPVNALNTCLHVSVDRTTIENTAEGDVWVTCQFDDGNVRVRMTQPGFGKGSEIWVPAEIEI